MKISEAKKLLKASAWLLIVLTIGALAGLILTLPASQRTDGLIGMACALVVLGAGFGGVYSFARVIEREQARVEGAPR